MNASKCIIFCKKESAWKLVRLHSQNTMQDRSNTLSDYPNLIWPLTLFYIFHISFCVRLNDAPVRGYEEDVGNKTTLRLFYPESASYNPGIHNDPDTLMVLVPFKLEDLRWLKEILYNEKRVSLSYLFPCVPACIWFPSNHEALCSI